MSDIVIRAEHLSKMYRLGVINNGTLWKDLQTWVAIKRGKEDPHSRIGEDKYSGDEDHFWALKDLDFEIKQGDRVGIIGKNGAGKSTLLKILSRITAPTEGTVKIRGKIASLLEVGTGFHGELTGRENIYLNGAILGMKKRQIDRKLDEIIDFSGIEHHIDTPVKRYSSGMYVRLAFAVAAHLDSDILIADEVLAVGDAEFQKKALGKMQDLSTGHGRTVLFVSHQMNFISSLCTSCLRFGHGRLVESGPTDKVVSNYLRGDANVPRTGVFYEPDGRVPISIINVEVRDSQDRLSVSLDMQEAFCVRIEYVVVAPVERAYVALHIMTTSGEIIIDSCDIDAEEELLGIRDPGSYSTRVNIPGHLLNQGEYFIEIWAGIPHLGIEFMTSEKLAVYIFDRGSILSKNNPVRECLLSVPLEWTSPFDYASKDTDRR